MQGRSHFDLRIWQEARALSLEIRVIVGHFPPQERSLNDQMRRAADSVSANIAEGVGRATKKDFSRFLGMARGSAHEMMDHLSLVQALKLVQGEETMVLMHRYKGLAAGIYAYMRAIEASGGK